MTKALLPPVTRPPVAVRLLLAAWAACLNVACASAAPPPATNTLWQRVMDSVGPASCQSDAVCRSIGVGHQPCGGPSSYLAWSTQSSREAELRERVAAHAQAEATAQARSGLMSHCAVAPDPGARCDTAAQRCVLQTQPAGQPGGRPGSGGPLVR